MPGIRIADGRSSLWQWDTGVRIIIDGYAGITEMHYPTPAGLISREVVDGTCEVPDVTLQTAGLLEMYAYDRHEDGSITRYAFCLPVNARPKPADYIDPPDEMDNLDALAERVAEKIGDIGGGIVVETDPTVPAWAKKPEPPAAPVQSVNGKTGAVSLNAQDVGALPVDTIKASASGAVVSVMDAAARPAVGLVSHIEAVQEGEGDPSPDNVRPIRGWDRVTLRRTGKNLCSVNDITFVQFSTVALESPIPPGSYYFEAKVQTTDTDNQLSQIAFYSNGALVSKLALGRDKLVSHKVTFARAVTDIYFYAAQSYDSGKGDEATYSDVMISPLQNSEYEPYTAQTLTADLPETVYGGRLDWTTGELTVTHTQMTLDGTEAWKKSAANAAGYAGFYIQISDSDVHDASTLPASSSHYPYIGSWSNSAISQRAVKILHVADTRITSLYIAETGYDTADAFKVYLSEQHAAGTPVTVVYKLATPYTIQLTPQHLDLLKGQNAIWSDTGNTDLVYVADLQMYIDQRLAAMAAAVVNQ